MKRSQHPVQPSVPQAAAPLAEAAERPFAALSSKHALAIRVKALGETGARQALSSYESDAASTDRRANFRLSEEGFFIAPDQKSIASIGSLTTKLEGYLSRTDIKRVRDAYRLADEAHLGQFRQSG
ncbi:MAG: hypothetical protein EBX64_00595, partial [Betaproteobacteria bacterium]|nr:hypothetical protein [Betaproteobacteria bacterium]